MAYPKGTLLLPADERLRRKSVAMPSGCIECGGIRCKGGYARITINGQFWAAHRLAWTLRNGPIPDGMLVCHDCDNPPCVNPEGHIRLIRSSEESGAELARQFGVSRGAICAIRHRRNWKHVN